METTPMFWVVFSLLLLGVIIVKYRKYNVQRALKLPKHPPMYADDAVKSAEEIGKFLLKRSTACGVYFLCADKDAGISTSTLYQIAEGKDYGVINFIRLAHYLGCEVVIRQVDTHDIENPENTPQIFAEYISKLEEEQRRRLYI